MDIQLCDLSEQDCQLARCWRNEALETLRTPYPLTEEQQATFYRNVILNPDSPHLYWGVRNVDRGMAGMAGLTYIQWENGLAELSLIIDPQQRGKGVGQQAVALLLEQAFGRLRLETVCFECYHCNGGLAFWQTIAEKYGAYTTMLPRRKFWLGCLWDAMYGSISKEQYRKVVPSA